MATVWAPADISFQQSLIARSQTHCSVVKIYGWKKFAPDASARRTRKVRLIAAPNVKDRALPGWKVVLCFKGCIDDEVQDF